MASEPLVHPNTGMSTEGRSALALESIAESLAALVKPKESDEEKFSRYLAWIEMKAGDPIKGRKFARFGPTLAKVAKVAKATKKII